MYWHITPAPHRRLSQTPSRNTKSLRLQRTMTYMIFGRAVRKEYLSIATLGSIGGIAAWASSGSKKQAPKNAEDAKLSVPLNAGSSEEEEFIRKFIAEAEKESAAASKH
ncbi:hypothetical protein C8J57DRAFT_1376996 [Mycena rebaudengoi]|nr:hypothetical protein C8J57DRAFT_1376996 [Mycena rebaudengoi]